MAVNPWDPQPASMTWGDGYDWLRRQRQQQAQPATDQYAVNDPWGGGGGGNTFNWAKQTTDPGLAGAAGMIGNAAQGAAKGVATAAAYADNPIVKTVQNPDGSATVTYRDGSTKTAYPAGANKPATTTPASKPAPGTTGAGYTAAQKTGTAGRTGASYAQFLKDHPDFDPWTNLDQYAGAGAGNDPILAQAFGWTNQWARNNNYADGSQIPLAQRQQVFLSNLERARQQFADYTVDGQPHPGAITWEQSQASRIPNSGWSYQAGSGLRGGAQPAAGQPAATGGGDNAQTGGEPVGAYDPQNTGNPPPGGGGTGTGVNGGYDLALQTDKARRMAALFQALGIGSPQQQRSWAGSNMMNIAQSLFDPWSQTQGLNGTTPTMQDMIAQFGRYMGAGGGGAASIRGDAANAIQKLGSGQGPLGARPDQEMLALLQSLSGLAHTGQNKLLQTGYGNLADEATGQYANAMNAVDRAGGNTADLSILKFLQDNPTYRFLVGR